MEIAQHLAILIFLNLEIKLMKKLLGIIVACLLFAGCASTGCLKGNCVDGEGTYQWKIGEKYEGEWKNDKRNGQGTNTWSDGRKYTGEWKDEKQHGYGVFIHSDGNKDVGEWVDGKFMGKLLNSSEIEQFFVDKTAYYKGGETEYHKADGTVFYNSKEEGLVTGKWFTNEDNKICFRYTFSDKTFCQEIFQKDGRIVKSNGNVVTLKTGDVENLASTLETKMLQERQAKQQALEAEKKKAEERKRQAKQAKKLVGKKVKWILDKDIESDNCILFGTICHSVTYRFRMIGVVSSVDLDEEKYRIKMSSIKLIPQEYVAPMYWKYKGRAQNWAATQQGRYRMVEFEYVSPL